MLKKRVQEEELSVIVVMHDFNMVERFCDRAILLKNGEVAAKGQIRDVLTPELLHSVYEVGFDIIEKEGRRVFFPKNVAEPEKTDATEK